MVWRIDDGREGDQREGYQGVRGSRVSSSGGKSRLRVVLIDFSSGYSEEAVAAGLYGALGPSEAEETKEMMPPERFFPSSFFPMRNEAGQSSSSAGEGSSGEGGGSRGGAGGGSTSDGGHSYYRPEPSFDSWTVGVFLLEVLLGTRGVFTVDQRTRATLSWRLRHTGRCAHSGSSCSGGETRDSSGTSRSQSGRRDPPLVQEPDPEVLERALFLAALSDYCIFHPGGGSNSEVQGSGVLVPANYSPTAVLKAPGPRAEAAGMGGAAHQERKGRFDFEEAVELFNLDPPHYHRCGVAEFASALHRRDPLEMGFEEILGSDGLDVLMGLLAFDPRDRLAPAEALKHAFLSSESSTTHDIGDETAAHSAGSPSASAFSPPSSPSAAAAPLRTASTSATPMPPRIKNHPTVVQGLVLRIWESLYSVCLAGWYGLRGENYYWGSVMVTIRQLASSFAASFTGHFSTAGGGQPTVSGCPGPEERGDAKGTSLSSDPLGFNMKGEKFGGAVLAQERGVGSLIKGAAQGDAEGTATTQHMSTDLASSEAVDPPPPGLEGCWLPEVWLRPRPRPRPRLRLCVL